MARRKPTDSPMSFFSFQDIIACVTGIMILVTLLLALDPLSSKIEEITNRVVAATPDQSQIDAIAESRRRAEDASARLTQMMEEVERRKSQPSISVEEVDRVEARVARESTELAAIEKRLQTLESETAQVKAATKEAKALTEVTITQWSDVTKRHTESQLKSRVRRHQGETDPLEAVMIEIDHLRVVWGSVDAGGVPRQRGESATADALKGLGEAFKSRTAADSYALFIVHDDAVAQFDDLRRAVASRGFAVGWQLWVGNDSFFEVSP